MRSSYFSKYKTIFLFLSLWLIASCGINETIVPPTDPPAASPIPTSTHTVVPPTATPIPLAVIINGVEFTLDEFEAELNRYISAQGSGTSIDRIDAGEIVLEDIISQSLLMQGAEENGFELTEEQFAERVNELTAAAGGDAPFNQWLLENGYSVETFDKTLERSIKAAWMRDQILAEVPNTAEHVYLHQIFLFDADQAAQVYIELQSGRDFATLAANNDPVTRGDLGWIPRNYLPHKVIEEEAFRLQPGEYSQVIETSVGFHIIQVVAIENDRLLSPEARLLRQEQAIRDWVALRRETSNIEILALE
ncbi:MAG: peptidylprolyl isomerase [Anaerolineales bacterium]